MRENYNVRVTTFSRVRENQGSEMWRSRSRKKQK